MKEVDLLKVQIEELKRQLEQKDSDLKIYRQELLYANQEIEKLIVASETQLDLARRLQKFLVTTEFPNLPGFQLSSKFKSSLRPGGDYFDVFSHQDKMKFGTFLSSSSGYGMSSLFLSVLMKLTFEIEQRQTQDPQSVLKEIFEQISGAEGGAEFASVFYGVFDRRKYRFEYSNVGQNYCFFYEAINQKIEVLQGVDEPFLPKSGETFQPPDPTTIDLAPRDKVILCSQGFAKLKNEEGQALGLDVFLSTLKDHVDAEVHELRNELFLMAEKFAPEPEADLTVIVVEVKDRIIKLA